MIALKTIRRAATELLADGLGVTVTPLGGNVNPPCVLMTAGSPYVEVLDYTTDRINLVAWVIPDQGQPEAVADALDDLLDLVRTALAQKHAETGIKFSSVEIGAPERFGEQELVSARCALRYDRTVD